MAGVAILWGRSGEFKGKSWLTAQARSGFRRSLEGAAVLCKAWLLEGL